MTKFLNNADIKGYIAQTAVTSYLLKADSTGRLVAAIAGTDYQAPTTALLPSGGTAGQILAKIDGTNYNAQWIDNFAQQIKYDVKLGAALSKGTPVYVSSANGTNIIVSASSNATEATSSKTLGLLETGGALNDIVKVVSDGLLSGLNTSTATIGDPVWLGVNGALIFGLANKPSAPAHLVYIGAVTRVHATNGEIFIKVQNGFELDELHNVALSSVADGQGLFYESATSLWKNKTIAAVLGYIPANGANYLPLTGGTISGDLTISSTNPRLYFTDTDNNPDYFISNTDGTFTVYDVTNSVGRFKIYSGGNAEFTGSVTTNSTFNITNGLTLFGNHISTQWYNGVDGVFVNYVGYNGGTTQFRNFYVYDGKQGVIATFDGSAKSFTLSGNLSVNNGANTAVSLNGSAFVGVEYSRASNIFGYVGTENSASGGMRYNSVNGNYEHTFYTNSVSSFKLLSTRQVQFTAYTTSSSFSGTAAGYLAFDSSGNVITVAGVAATDNTKLPLAGGTMTGLLAFSNVTGNKIDFYHTITGSGDRYGVQVQNSELRIHSGAGGDAAGGITFGKSTTTTFTEAMRIRNDGIVQTTGYLRTAGVTSNTVYWSAGANSADFGNALGQGTSSRSTMFRGNGSSTSVWWAGTDANGTVIPFTAIDATSGEFTFWRNSGGLGGGSWTNIMTMNANGLSINSGYLVVPSIYSGGGSITLGNNVLVPAGDRGFEVNASGGISLYSNEINAGALGGTGTIYLGWRRTSQINVGVPISSNSTIAATGAISTTVSASAWGFLATTSGYSNGSGIWFSSNVGELLLRKADGTLSTRISADGTYAFINNNNIIHAGNIGSQSVTYATNSTRLYASDSPYTYGGAAPYYLYMNYDGGSYWELKVSPATPGTVRVAYANSAGSASSASTSSQVTINYNNDSNSTYQLLWGSGNNVYGTSQVYVNPSSDVIYARGGYVSPGNPWGTSDSAYFPNGITTAGGQNWIYGATFIGNAPSNGSGVLINSNGSSYFRSNVGTNSHGSSARFHEIQSAAGNFIPYSFESEYGNHSWGTVLRIRINQVGADRPSMQFSYAGTDNRWNVGYCYPDDQFRVTQNMAYRNDNSTSDGWGTERFRINTNGDTYAAIGGTLYANGNQVLTYAGGTLSNNYTFRSNLGGYLGSLSSPPLQVYSESNNSAFMSFHKGGYYAVNFGLDADNVMRIGGWSASSNRWQLDMSGNQTVAGNMSSSGTAYAYGYRGNANIGGTGEASWHPAGIYSGGTEWFYGTMFRNGSDTYHGWGNLLEVGAIYSNNWFRAYGDTGLYSQDYGGYFRRNTNSYGTWESTGYAKNGWGGYVNNNNYIVSWMLNTSGDFGFLTQNGNWWNLFYNNGNNCWGIGTDNTYSGDGFRCIKYGSSQYGWTTWSDRRAKENISNITGALDKVLNMRGVYFNYISDEAKNKRVGFIAQELESVLPEAVRYAEEIDEYNVEYAQIVSVLAEAIKEQNAKIQTLEDQLQTLLN